MADNLAILDGNSASRALATKDLGGGVHLTKHLLAGEDGAPISPATQATLAAVLAALADLAPATDLPPVTPSDTTPLTGVRSLYVGTGGTVVLTVNGQIRTLVNVPDGSILPVKGITRVRAATTASNIVALV